MKNIKNYLIFLFVLIAAASAYTQSSPYVILVSFDGFRWDYANRGITPNIDYMKENGVAALSLQPCFPSKTFPNHYSIITGMYPEHHGIIFNDIPDNYTGERFTLRDSIQVNNSYWYKGEAFWETARRQGIITASYFWPGSSLDIEYRRPDYFQYYEHERPYDKRVNGVINWLKLPYAERPHFITLYFDATDTEGHKYGPDSPETNAAIARLDSVLGSLFNQLKSINMIDSVNIILVSDHGMTSVDNKRVINVEKILSGYECEFSNRGPVMMVQPKKEKVYEVYELLKANARNYKVYRRGKVPEYYHFNDNPLIFDIVIVADLGWSLALNKDVERMKKYSRGGNHGYDNHQMDMHASFFAMGPAFKKGYKTGTLLNIDVYPLLCKIFNIIPSPNIDGKLERIEFILKEN